MASDVKQIIWEIEGYIRNVSKQLHPQIIPTGINQVISRFYGPLWNKYDHKPSRCIRRALICIENIMWLSSTHISSISTSENGMIQYDCTTNKVTEITKYPDDVIPKGHVCCKYDDKIYIIDGVNGEITSFDPSLKTYQKKINFSKISGFPGVLPIFDKIHIMGGKDNDSLYFIYNPVENEIKEYESKVFKNISSVLILKYKNQMIRFGGLNNEEDQYTDVCMITAEIKPDDDNDPEWKEKPEWKLPKLMNQFGLVLYKHYILIFGGGIWDHIKVTYQTAIYLLDLDGNESEGWKELNHIKCPDGAWYNAVITMDNYVHLISTSTREDEYSHYSLHIANILGSKYLNL